MKAKAPPQAWEEPRWQAASPNAAVSDPLDLSMVLSFVWRHLYLLLLMAFLGALAAVAVMVLLPTRYTATALISVETRDQKQTPYEDALPGIGPDVAAFSSIIEIANSDATLQALLRQLNLSEYPELTAPSWFGTNTEADIMARLARTLRIQRRGVTYVIEVSATLKDAQKAASLANIAADYIARRQRDTRTGASQDVVEGLKAKIQGLEDDAKASQDAVDRYREEQGLTRPGAEGSIGERRLTYLAQQIALTREKLEAARARYDEVRRAKPLDLDTPAAAATSLLATLRIQYATERRQAAELAQVYGPRHPNVKISRERLAVLAGQLRAEIARLTANSQTEVDALQQQIAAMEGELKRQNQSEAATATQHAELARRESKAGLDRDILDQFRKKLAVTTEQKDLAPSDLVTVSPAMPPIRSTKPPLVLVAAGGAMSGLLLGMVLAYAWRGRVPGVPIGGNPALVQPVPGLPGAAQRPAGPPQPGLAPPPPATAPTPIAVVAMIDALPAPPPAAPGSNAALLDVVDARVALAPFFGHFSGLLQPRNGQLMAVATLGSTLGRTTAAVAMAHLAAQAGASVLVISDHGQGVTPAAGLRDIVLGYANPRGLARYDASSDFTVMRTGCATPSDFWGLIGHRNFAAVAGMLKEFWDFVVVEVPPLRDELPPPLPTALFGSLLLIADPRIIRHPDIVEAVSHWPPVLQKAAVVVYNYPPPRSPRTGIHAWAT